MTTASLDAPARAALSPSAPGGGVAGDGGLPTARQYLSFWLGEQQLAVSIAPVREIIQFGPVTRVPLMPGFVRGVINLRGAVVPVIDLCARLGRGNAAVGERSSIVIFERVREGERVTLGLLVDAVSEVVDLPVSGIEPPPRFGGLVQRHFLEGVAQRSGRTLSLLEVDAVLDVDDMARRCEAALATEPA